MLRAYQPRRRTGMPPRMAMPRSTRSSRCLQALRSRGATASAPPPVRKTTGRPLSRRVTSVTVRSTSAAAAERHPSSMAWRVSRGQQAQCAGGIRGAATRRRAGCGTGRDARGIAQQGLQHQCRAGRDQPAAMQAVAIDHIDGQRRADADGAHGAEAAGEVPGRYRADPAVIAETPARDSRCGRRRPASLLWTNCGAGAPAALQQRCAGRARPWRPPREQATTRSNSPARSSHRANDVDVVQGAARSGASRPAVTSRPLDARSCPRRSAGCS